MKSAAEKMQEIYDRLEKIDAQVLQALEENNDDLIKKLMAERDALADEAADVTEAEWKRLFPTTPEQYDELHAKVEQLLAEEDSGSAEN